MKTNIIIQCGIFAAIIAIFSVITIPIGTIPITLGLFGVLLAAVILGAKRSAAAVLVYILIGAVGLPVFSGFRGGFTVITGPTGGYLIAYTFTALVSGKAAELAKKRTGKPKLLICFCGCVLGVLISYIFGTIHFCAISESNVSTAITLCILPFIPFDLLKCFAASVIGLKTAERVSPVK